MKLTRTFKELCTPAKLYFAISVIAILIALFSRVKVSLLLIKGFFVVIWTFILNLLCKNGFKTFSWFLVLLPYFMIILAVLLAFFKIKSDFREGAEVMGAVAPEEVKDAVASNLSGEALKKWCTDPKYPDRSKDDKCKIKESLVGKKNSYPSSLERNYPHSGEGSPFR